jgi:acylglycerol lipase
MACYLMGMNNLTDGTILIVPAIMDNYYNRPYLKYVALIFGALIPRLSLFPEEPIHGSKNP